MTKCIHRCIIIVTDLPSLCLLTCATWQVFLWGWKVTEYTKAPFTYQQQLELLESRGLSGGDSQEAVKFLKQVNYYRFSAYCVPFQNPRDTFIPGTTFEKIIELYSWEQGLPINSVINTVRLPIMTYPYTRMKMKEENGSLNWKKLLVTAKSSSFSITRINTRIIHSYHYGWQSR